MLKRIPVLIIILTLFISQHTYSQRIKGAIIGGMNLSQVDGDEVYGFRKFGVNAGAAAIIPFGKNWSVTIENVYSEKGAREKSQYSIFIDTATEITGEYFLKLNYVEVPVLVHYNDQNRITAGMGFSWGRLFNATEEEHGGNQEPYVNEVPFSKNDFNWLADVRFRVYKRLWFNVRYAYSIAKIRERDGFSTYGSKETWSRKQYNNLWSFRLVYIFNEKLPEERVNEEELTR